MISLKSSRNIKDGNTEFTAITNMSGYEKEDFKYEYYIL